MSMREQQSQTPSKECTTVFEDVKEQKSVMSLIPGMIVVFFLSE